MIKAVVNRSTTRVLIAVVLAASAAKAAVAQTLWRGAAVGDRLDALHRRFPEAAPPSKPATLSAGEVEALQLPVASLAGLPAIASFFLRDGALVDVQLRVQALPSASTAANLAFAQSVAELIGRQAGAGYDCGANTMAGVAQFSCRWLQSQVVIKEYYLDVAGQAPIFYLSYRRADDPAFEL